MIPGDGVLPPGHKRFQRRWAELEQHELGGAEVGEADPGTVVSGQFLKGQAWRSIMGLKGARESQPALGVILASCLSLSRTPPPFGHAPFAPRTPLP